MANQKKIVGDLIVVKNKYRFKDNASCHCRLMLDVRDIDLNDAILEVVEDWEKVKGSTYADQHEVVRARIYSQKKGSGKFFGTYEVAKVDATLFRVVGNVNSLNLLGKSGSD